MHVSDTFYLSRWRGGLVATCDTLRHMGSSQDMIGDVTGCHSTTAIIWVIKTRLVPIIMVMFFVCIASGKWCIVLHHAYAQCDTRSCYLTVFWTINNWWASYGYHLTSCGFSFMLSLDSKLLFHIWRVVVASMKLFFIKGTCIHYEWSRWDGLFARLRLNSVEACCNNHSYSF